MAITPVKGKPMKKALIVLTSHATLGNTGKPTGWYLPEVSHIYFPLLEAGFEVDFASPKGGAAPMDPPSDKREDPLNRRFMEDAALQAQVRRTLALEVVDPSAYGVIFFAGGHGTMWDFPANPALSRVAAAIYEAGGIVSAVCHGPAALVDIKLSNGRYLIEGKTVNGFTDKEEQLVGLTGVVPFLLESKLKERSATFKGGEPWSSTVVVSERVLTGQNPQSAKALAQALVQLSGPSR